MNNRKQTLGTKRKRRPGNHAKSQPHKAAFNSGISAEQKRNFRAFLVALPRLLKSDPGKFVAIANGQIIDRDANEMALAARVAVRYPDRRILIQPVIEGGMRDIEL